MAVFELFSKRQKKLRGDIPDVYVYDQIPEALRVQIIHVMRENLGTYQIESYSGRLTETGTAYKEIVQILRKEYGVFALPGTRYPTENQWMEELSTFLVTETDTERVLDTIELLCNAFDTYVRSGLIHGHRSDKRADDAISEMNHRLMEHGVGYQFEHNKVIRIDSQLVHAQVVKPALTLLHNPLYRGVQNEFLSAHEHYRKVEYKETLVDCLKSIESMLKAICDKRKWAYDSKAACSTLLQICFDNGLVPQFWAQYFNALRSTIESGVPTARNRLGGHGQGSTVTQVPDYIASYVIHQTASVLVFLGEAEKALK